MKIAGLQKLTLIDYPGKPACTVFLAGCNLRCPWCHSPDLVIPEAAEEVPEIEEDFFGFLKKRKKVLEGVVICGGEPTVNRGLDDFIEKIKDLDYEVKLDTNGTDPKTLERLIKRELLDYVAMDLKAPPGNYKGVTGVDVDPAVLRESIFLVKGMNNYEFRTTVVPGIHDQKKLLKILEEIKGAKKYFLQNFRGKITVDKSFQDKEGFSPERMEKFKSLAQKYVQSCKIR